jgi:hypothetical protein
MLRMRRAASSAVSRTWRSVRLLFRLARVLSALLVLPRLPELLDVPLSLVPEEPRLLRADLPLLPEESEVDSPPVPVESFDVVSVLPVSCVLAVELALLLLSVLFLEQPTAAIATAAAKAMIRNPFCIVYHSP